MARPPRSSPASWKPRRRQRSMPSAAGGSKRRRRRRRRCSRARDSRFDGESHRSVVVAGTAHTGYKVPTTARRRGDQVPPRRLVNVAPISAGSAGREDPGRVILEATIAVGRISVKGRGAAARIPAARRRRRRRRSRVAHSKPTLINGVPPPSPQNHLELVASRPRQP